MTPTDQYRRLAATLRNNARDEPLSHLKAEWDHLAESYDLLAQQAEENARTDMSYEPILGGQQCIK